MLAKYLLAASQSLVLEVQVQKSNKASIASTGKTKHDYCSYGTSRLAVWKLLQLTGNLYICISTE